MISGIIPVDKPAGFTSFDVVAKVRGITHQKKIGHSGTLDPMATGVLPLFFNEATKTLSILQDEDKKYVACLKFGIKTDTQDITGEILSQKESSVSYELFTEVIKKFIGRQFQVPPMYSATKINGVPLYDLARQGIEVERKSKEIQIYSIDIKSFDEQNQKAEIEVSCGRGTFIRTLISDMGDMLGCGAVMTDLRRTKACGFDISECLSLEEIQVLSNQGNLEGKAVSPKRLFQNLPKIVLGEYDSRLYSNGVELELKKRNFSHMNGLIAIFNESGNLLGISEMNLDENKLKLIKMLNIE